MTLRFRGLSITQRLFMLTLVALLPAAAVVTYYILSNQYQREREVHALALQYGQMASLEMDRIISGVQGVLYVLSNTLVVREFQQEGCNRLLLAVNEDLPQVLGLAVIDAEGLVRCSAPVFDEPIVVDEHTPIFAEIMESGHFVVGEFLRSRLEDTPSIPLGLPVRDGAGQIIGVVATAFDPHWLGQQLRDRALTEGSSLTIADRNGIVIAREPHPEQFVGTRIPDDFQHLVRATAPGSVEVQSQDGTRRVIGYYPPAYSGTGLYVSYGLSRELAFAPITAATQFSIAIALFGALAVLLVAWMMGDRLFRQPIGRLLATIEAWRRGDDRARTGIRRSQDELSMLGAAIDEYMDELVADRAARQRAEQHRDLVVRELDHRVKNILSTVQAVASQSFRNAGDREAFEAFAGRLGTMASAHEMLMAGNWRDADLRRTLEVAIRPFEGEGGSRFALTGPPVGIRARAALALSMAMHELCTNAVKYGALGAEGGTVAIDWSIEDGAEGKVFRMRWSESGGPPVVPSERKGFGTVMIERAMAAELSAEVKIDFAPAGLECAIRCQLASLAPEE